LKVAEIRSADIQMVVPGAAEAAGGRLSEGRSPTSKRGFTQVPSCRTCEHAPGEHSDIETRPKPPDTGRFFDIQL
jgi:hypothetical protein